MLVNNLRILSETRSNRVLPRLITVWSCPTLPILGPRRLTLIWALQDLRRLRDPAGAASGCCFANAPSRPGVQGPAPLCRMAREQRPLNDAGGGSDITHSV
ncbi:hypothetical protein NDU88_003312 [Pleurodeles waltl]|uniref:Uncharacterized protein n=1 Tax=Pleurodeles waltl TaxID=8319 RepID=A0AAV7TNR3_PLEWA|nr:hypothetical protein NDU88_003312 [Pleurodeles waltl]